MDVSSRGGVSVCGYQEEQSGFFVDVRRKRVDFFVDDRRKGAVV